MIKAVIFDFFGVLCSDHYWQFVKADQMGDSVYKQYSDEVNLGEITWQAFIEKTAKMMNVSADQVNKMYELEKIDPRVAGLIDDLHQNYKTALLTNAHHEFIDDLLDTNHLRRLFDEVFISSKIGAMKPDPRVFEFALQRLGVSAEEALYVDDLSRHTNSASSLGMKTVLYNNFTQAQADIKHLLTT